MCSFKFDTSPIKEGLTVIEASAGTGKTYAISHLVPRLLIDGTVKSLSSILLVTFTNDAARELGDRVRRVLTQLADAPQENEAQAHPGVAALRVLMKDHTGSEAVVRQALNQLDLLSVSTIHAFCQRTLQREGTLCGLPTIPNLVTDDSEFLDEIVQEFWEEHLATHRFLAGIALHKKWEPSETAGFLKQWRKFPRIVSQPSPKALAVWENDLHTQLGLLSSPAAQTAFLTAATGITTWNKGATPDPVAMVDRLNAALPDYKPALWTVLQEIAGLPDQAGAKSKANKALKEALESSALVTGCTAAHALLEEADWVWHHAVAAQIQQRVDAELARRRLITQDGIIRKLRWALTEGPRHAQLAANLAGRYEVALIDESQDTDPDQFEIFSRIFLNDAHKRRLILIGDPKQAIFGFRGADVQTYLDACNRCQMKYTLNETYRAPQRLVSTINAVFDSPNSFLRQGLTFAPAKSGLKGDFHLKRGGAPAPRMEVWMIPEAQAHAFGAKDRRKAEISARVATAIVDVLRDGTLVTKDEAGKETGERPVRPNDIAVLVSRNDQAAAVQEQLRERGVPAIIAFGRDVLASDEAADLHCVLRAVLEPRSSQLRRAALATRIFGYNAADLQALPENDEDDAWLERFNRWLAIWQSRGLASLFAEIDALEDNRAPSARLAPLPITGERRVTNYRQLTDLLLATARTEGDRPEFIVRWLGQEIARAKEDDRTEAPERQLQIESDRKAVQIVTMHKAKGLEYDVVFCPYLWDGTQDPKGLNILRRSSAKPQDQLVNAELAGSAGGLIEALTAAQLEERLRLAYVALTRAKAYVCFTAGCLGHKPKSGLDSGVVRANAVDWLLRENPQGTPFSAAWAEAARATGREGQAGREDRHTAGLNRIRSKDTEDLICVVPIPDARPDLWQDPGADADAASLGALEAPEIPRAWRITSFSSLTREKHGHGQPERPAPVEATAANAAPCAVPEPNAFFSAPAGAAVGTLVHAFLETWDFAELDAEALDSFLKPPHVPANDDAMKAFWKGTLTSLFGRLRQATLPGLGEPLHAACGGAHASEWHFHLPLGEGFSVQALAEAFAQHGAPEHKPYASILAALPPERLNGLLQGFIDRLVRHGDAWGVIDWKTNRLGSALADYDPSALLECAMREHYLLQTHLYLVALRRYLWLAGLDASGLAGAWLIFLRAVEPGSNRGILHIDPAPAMLDALDALFAPALCPVCS